MTKGAPGVFGPGAKKSGDEQLGRERDELHAKIGKQAVEIDFLTKKSKQLGL